MVSGPQKGQPVRISFGGQGGIRDHKGRAVTSDPKSAASKTTLPVPTALMNILAKRLAAKGVNASDGDRLLF